MSDEAFDHQKFLALLSTGPGIYQMLDGKANVIYVGKARNLKNRVASYFRGEHQGKTAALMQQVRDVQVIITSTEAEALLLEDTLIKKFQPHYNVIFKDDRSYPFIYISEDHAFPRLDYCRGKRQGRGRYFGPYPNASAVKEYIHLMQKLFKIRSCRDVFFKNRTRPCLQYQIKRCSAPCVDYITEENYRRDLHYAIQFLEGKDDSVIENMITRMEQASSGQDYEQAAVMRDNIAALRQVHQQQYISREQGEVDVIVVSRLEGMVGVQMVMIRQGKVLGARNFFPRVPQDAVLSEVVQAFISQHYLQPDELSIPQYIITNILLEESDWLGELLSQQLGRKIQLTSHPRGDRARWMEMAIKNLAHALSQKLSVSENLQQRFQQLSQRLNLSSAIERIECFDISHTQGEGTVASCVVFSEAGPQTQNYRRFNIKSITPGDDYAAMYQALTRRYTRLKTDGESLPTLLLIDGGKGQVAKAQTALEELQITDTMIIGIAKGPSRKPGLESIIFAWSAEEVAFNPSDPALHLLQQIRDEAHRFAITGHRKQRAKARTHSVLQDIPGIGPKKRKALLQRFGGLHGLRKASLEELRTVPGIHRKLAEQLIEFLQKK